MMNTGRYGGYAILYKFSLFWGLNGAYHRVRLVDYNKLIKRQLVQYNIDQAMILLEFEGGKKPKFLNVQSFQRLLPQLFYSLLK